MEASAKAMAAIREQQERTAMRSFVHWHETDVHHRTERLLVIGSIIYHVVSLGLFSFYIFVLDKNPWWFALMIVLDLLFNSYTKRTTGNSGSSVETENGAQG